MKVLYFITIVFDIILCLGSVINLITGNHSVNDYIVLYFTISILVGVIVKMVCKKIRAKRSKE